jgi:3D (Asp-Asp-Asp) domain-containing protein
MMKKSNFTIVFVVSLLFSSLEAQEADCRNLARSSVGCDTYGAKLLCKVKPVKYQDRKKIITAKTLPLLQKKKVKVVTIDKFIENHIHINDSVRFRTSSKRIYTKSSSTQKIRDNNLTKTPTVATKKKIQPKKDKLVSFIENWDKDKKSIYAKQAKPKKIVQKPKEYKIVEPNSPKSLSVVATAYTSHRNQTDSTPFVAAWGNRIGPGMRIIAVSRDLIRKHGLKNGTKVRITGLPETYIVRDKMNERFCNKIDIYMGVDKRKAIRWGRRYVKLSW